MFRPKLLGISSFENSTLADPTDPLVYEVGVRLNIGVEKVSDEAGCEVETELISSHNFLATFATLKHVQCAIAAEGFYNAPGLVVSESFTWESAEMFVESLLSRIKENSANEANFAIYELFTPEYDTLM